MATARIFFFLVLVVFIQSTYCSYLGGILPRGEMMTSDLGQYCSMVEIPSDSSAISYMFNGMLFLSCFDETGSITQEFVAHCIDGKWKPNLSPQICSEPAPLVAKNHSSLKEVHTHPGGTAFLLCGNSDPPRSSDENYVFDWYRFDAQSKFSLYSNNKTLPETPKRYSFHNNKLTGSSTLIIEDVDPSDGGEYVCGVQSTTDGKEFSFFARHSVVLKVIAPGKPLWPDHQTDIQMKTIEVQERNHLMNNISALIKENEKLQKLVDEDKNNNTNCTSSGSNISPIINKTFKEKYSIMNETVKVYATYMDIETQNQTLRYAEEAVAISKNPTEIAEYITNKCQEKYSGHWNIVVLPRILNSKFGIRVRYKKKHLLCFGIETFLIIILKQYC